MPYSAAYHVQICNELASLLASGSCVYLAPLPNSKFDSYLACRTADQIDHKVQNINASMWRHLTLATARSNLNASVAEVMTTWRTIKPTIQDLAFVAAWFSCAWYSGSHLLKSPSGDNEIVILLLRLLAEKNAKSDGLHFAVVIVAFLAEEHPSCANILSDLNIAQLLRVCLTKAVYPGQRNEVIAEQSFDFRRYEPGLCRLGVRRLITIPQVKKSPATTAELVGFAMKWWARLESAMVQNNSGFDTPGKSRPESFNTVCAALELLVDVIEKLPHVSTHVMNTIPGSSNATGRGSLDFLAGYIASCDPRSALAAARLTVLLVTGIVNDANFAQWREKHKLLASSAVLLEAAVLHMKQLTANADDLFEPVQRIMSEPVLSSLLAVCLCANQLRDKCVTAMMVGLLDDSMCTAEQQLDSVCSTARVLAAGLTQLLDCQPQTEINSSSTSSSINYNSAAMIARDCPDLETPSDVLSVGLCCCILLLCRISSFDYVRVAQEIVEIFTSLGKIDCQALMIVVGAIADKSAAAHQVAATGADEPFSAYHGSCNDNYARILLKMCAHTALTKVIDAMQSIIVDATVPVPAQSSVAAGGVVIDLTDDTSSPVDEVMNSCTRLDIVGGDEKSVCGNEGILEMSQDSYVIGAVRVKTEQARLSPAPVKRNRGLVDMTSGSIADDLEQSSFTYDAQQDESCMLQSPVHGHRQAESQLSPPLDDEVATTTAGSQDRERVEEKKSWDEFFEEVSVTAEVINPSQMPDIISQTTVAAAAPACTISAAVAEIVSSAQGDEKSEFLSTELRIANQRIAELEALSADQASTISSVCGHSAGLSAQVQTLETLSDSLQSKLLASDDILRSHKSQITDLEKATQDQAALLQEAWQRMSELTKHHAASSSQAKLSEQGSLEAYSQCTAAQKDLRVCRLQLAEATAQRVHFESLCRQSDEESRSCRQDLFSTQAECRLAQFEGDIARAAVASVNTDLTRVSSQLLAVTEHLETAQQEQARLQEQNDHLNSELREKDNRIIQLQSTVAEMSITEQALQEKVHSLSAACGQHQQDLQKHRDLISFINKLSTDGTGATQADRNNARRLSIEVGL